MKVETVILKDSDEVCKYEPSHDEFFILDCSNVSQFDSSHFSHLLRYRYNICLINLNTLCVSAIKACFPDDTIKHEESEEQAYKRISSDIWRF